jgi:RNA polymerase sigma-70 factor (ECF subfamily)
MQSTIKYQEHELLALVRQRTREGFNYLYENYSGAIYSVILTIVSDPEQASDTLQEVFVKIWKQIETYDEQKGRLYTWMVQIARNSSIDVVRSKKYQAHQQNREITESVYKVGDNDFNPDNIGIRKAVNQLKKEHKELVDLSYFQGYTQEEMSEILKIPLGTVKTRMRSAMMQLRKIFKQ